MVRIQIKMMLLVLVLSASLFAVERESVPLLREGFQLDYIKGVISKTEDGQWVFASDTELSDGLRTVSAKSKIEILPSSMLEKLTADISSEGGKEVESLDVRLQANVMNYRNRNYLYATSYIPISESKKAATQPTQKATEQKPEPKQAMEPKNDPILSDEVKELLKPDWSPDLGQKRERDMVKVEEDYSMPARTGFFEDKGGVKYFQLDSLGRKINPNSYQLLPCSALEAAENAKYIIPGRKRYVISGTVTTYKGQKYLMAQRIVRTYNNGNFAR